jgi:sterol 14-demethylase
VDLVQEFSELIILTASRTLMGREVRENMFEQVATLYHDLDMGMLPISVMFPYLPIPAHFKRDKARAELAKIFRKIIDNRRATGAKEDDLLQVFIDSKYRSAYGGRPLTNEEITGMLIAALFAGQHTSSITSAWTGLLMLAHPDLGLEPALEEQKRILQQHGGKLDMEILSSMDVLHRNITEALRMYPPLIMLLRQCHKSFSVTDSKGEQYVVPKGHIVFTSPAYSMRLPNVFEQPNSYDPDRFAREEDKKVPFSFIGFGGGRHGCMGGNFAYLQIKTIWSILLRNFEFEFIDPFPEADYASLVVGPKPCKIRFSRRKLVR